MQIVYTSNSAIVSDMYGRSQPRKSYACQKWPSFSTCTPIQSTEEAVKVAPDDVAAPLSDPDDEFCVAHTFR